MRGAVFGISCSCAMESLEDRVRVVQSLEDTMYYSHFLWDYLVLVCSFIQVKKHQ